MLYIFPGLMSFATLQVELRPFFDGLRADGLEQVSDMQRGEPTSEALGTSGERSPE